MSQNDFTIANQTAPNFRSDLNDALAALASLSSGATAPAATFANQLWYDTANKILKVRSESDDAWISMGYLDQSTNTFRLLDDTQVVNTSGTQTGLIGDQTTATWETGTSTTESLVSPAKVRSTTQVFHDWMNAKWVNKTSVRSAYTEYTNGNSFPLDVLIRGNDGNEKAEVSSDGGTTWVTVGGNGATGFNSFSFTVPPGDIYKYARNPTNWSERDG